MNKVDDTCDVGYKFEIGKLSVGDITITEDGKFYKFNPKKDITTYELGRLINLFFFISARSGIHYRYTFVDYIKEHKLERHFDVTD